MSESPTPGWETDMEGVAKGPGRHLGFTEWRTMTQPEIDRFADLTDDHNFIHVDPERAAATPFGGTIAHGFLSLALLAPATQRLHVTDSATAVNYGVDRVRFPAPLAVGAQWRAGAEITEVEPVKGGVQVKMVATLEVRDSERPACVAECVFRYYA